MSCCKQCGTALKTVEVGLTMKLIDRGAKEYLCLDCLAAFFSCDRELLLKKAEQFRKQGCTLFPSDRTKEN